MHDVHNRRSTPGAALVLFSFALSQLLLSGANSSAATFVTSSSDGVFRTDNLGYIRQPSATGIQVSVFQNGQKMNAGNGNLYFPHSTIIAQDGAITDTQFFNLLSNNLTSNGNWTQDSLDIHMAQCFSGGFIDELDLGNVQNVEINTASQWASPSVGTVGNKVYQYNVPNGNGAYVNYTNGNNLYSNAWYKALTGATAPAGSVNTYSTTLIGGYLLGQTNDPAHAQELPQYFSRGTQYISPQTGAPQSFNLMDSDVIGTSAATTQPIQNNEFALVFVGNALDQEVTLNGLTNLNVIGLRHWNDAINYMTYLLAQGYSADRIYFYYGNGVAPAYGQALPAPLTVDGAATTANFNNFFTDVVKGSTGQVNVWTSDHGGLNNVFQGTAPLKKAAGGKGNVVLNLQLLNSLDEYASNPYGDAQLQIPAGGITGLTSGDQMDVLLSDPQGDQFDLGTIASDGGAGDAWSLDIPLSDLITMDQNELAASDLKGEVNIELADYAVMTDPSVDDTTGLYSGDYSNVSIDDVSLNFGVNQTLEAVPEPGTLAMLTFGGVGLLIHFRRKPRVALASAVGQWRGKTSRRSWVRKSEAPSLTPPSLILHGPTTQCRRPPL